MDAPDPSRDTAKLHVSTLLVASERALINALDELGFAENDDRIIEHEGRFAFITCSHDADCDDLFALISELAARGETWELQFRIDTSEGRAIFQRFAQGELQTRRIAGCRRGDERQLALHVLNIV